MQLFIFLTKEKLFIMAQLRRKDRALDNESTLQALENGLYGMLATCGADGPYAVPVNYVFSGGCIYFHCARAGEKLDNLAFDNRACFTVVSDTSLEAGIVVSKTPGHTDRTALSAVRVMRLCCTKITGKGRLEAQE